MRGKLSRSQMVRVGRLLLALGSGSLLFACGNPTTGSGSPSRMPTPDSPYVKVLVSKDGVVSVDGQTKSLDELDVSLVQLAEKHGVVLYTRESPDESPHTNATKVIDLVVKRKLPIRLCKKLDFSDGISPDGKLKLE